jgi:enoyl-CoA hydratase/carnithine racemase
MRSFETISTREESGVLFASLNSPPMNLIGRSLVRDLLDLLIALEQDEGIAVVVFTSADEEFFIPHVDLTQVAEYSKEAARAGGLASGSLGGVFRRLSDARQVTIAQIEGFARGAGSEFALACDMRFASRERAIFAQIEAGFGASPGAGAIQHLTRLMGRGRAMEAILSASDYDADTAERYGWINRALPQDELGRFVHDLAVRIAAFPSAGLVAVKRRINALALPALEDVRDDAALFKETISAPRARARTAELMRGGMQTRGDIERHFAVAIGDLTA